jgi:hypothetical protein
MKILDEIKIELRGPDASVRTLYINVEDNTLSRKWLAALNYLLEHDYHLEKNYCFLGWTHSKRNGAYILDQVNASIAAVNSAGLGYCIDDHFSMENCVTDDVVGTRQVGRNIRHNRMNQLHRYFEDLQGVSGRMSPYYLQATADTRWHIRQLNLLCHEFETWCMSYRKELEAPEWQRPSQLMCWLNAPRFELEPEDYELFGVETMNRDLGGVFVGVNKAVGKHHWEVFHDEGRDSRVDELTTSTLRAQTEAAGDFDIEWGQNPGAYEFQQRRLTEFREWLIANGFDPNNRALTIGHPKVAQVDLQRSFGTTDHQMIWGKMSEYLDVVAVRTSTAQAQYDYRWDDADFIQRQVRELK